MHSDRAATRNENTFKDADRFDPDRYLDPAVTLPPVFGWGIRYFPIYPYMGEPEKTAYNSDA